MKLIVVLSLLIATALSFVTNLVSGFLSRKAEKHKKLMWVIFGVLLLASIIFALIPEELYSAKIEILETAVSTIYKGSEQENQNANLTYVYCQQQIKLVNRGNMNTSVVKYTANIKYRDFVTTVESFSSQSAKFTPYDLDDKLGKFEIRALPFIGDATLSPLPSTVFAQRTLDFVTSVYFAFDSNAYKIFNVHSSNMPEGVIPVLVQYQFDLADNAKIQSDDVPCAFLYAETILEAPK